LAWAQITGDVTPSPDDVKIFRNWPGQDAKIVPSAISYSTSTTTRRCKQWGWSIDDNSGVLRWTKLEFEHRTKLKELEVFQELIKGLDLVKTLQNSATTGEAEIPKQISKNAEDVVRDYLNKIARQWFQYMRSEGRFTLEQVHLDIILTHPAVSKRPPKSSVLDAMPLVLVLRSHQQNPSSRCWRFSKENVSNPPRYFVHFRTGGLFLIYRPRYAQEGP
jgi:hypothetical protein